MDWTKVIKRLTKHYSEFDTTSYHLEGMPNSISAESLPALIPNYGESKTYLGYYSDGWLHRIDFVHEFLTAPAWSSEGIKGEYQELAEWTDLYLTRLKQVELILHKQEVSANIQIIEYAGIRFYGVRFKHQWAIKDG